MNNGNFGLYRDEGLGLVKGIMRQVENIKSIRTIFRTEGLWITININKKQ